TATTEIYTLSLHDALPICLLEPARPLHGGQPHLVSAGWHAAVTRYDRRGGDRQAAGVQGPLHTERLVADGLRRHSALAHRWTRRSRAGRAGLLSEPHGAHGSARERGVGASDIRGVQGRPCRV